MKIYFIVTIKWVSNGYIFLIRFEFMREGIVFLVLYSQYLSLSDTAKKFHKAVERQKFG